MVKLKQALILDPPSELHFTPPFDVVTISYLNLSNPTEKQICFKLKTTAPKTYCVRPNSGIIKPSQTITVAVMLQPINVESVENMKHKFMVQSVFAPDGEFNQENLWRETSEDELMNSKLKCVFDIPSAHPPTDAGDSGVDVIDARTADESASDVTGEGAKSGSPKISNVESGKSDKETKKLLLESHLKTAKEEYKRLMEQFKELRSENAQYKEEHLRLRRSRANLPSQESQTSGRVVMQDMTPITQDSFLFSREMIAMAIAALLIGIVIGIVVF